MSERFSPDTDIQVIHRQDAVAGGMAPDVQDKAPYFHYQCEFLLTVEGVAEFNVSGQVYQVGPGTVLCINNLENHFIISNSADYDRYTARFSNEALAALIHDPLLLSIFKQRPEGFCHQYVCTPKEAARYARMLSVMVREYDEQRPYWDYVTVGRMRDILVSMYRRAPEAFPGTRRQAGQALISDVQNYVEAHLSENLQLETVAARFYVNKFHLSHSFKSVTGYAYKQYVIMARLSKAKDLLLNGRESVQHIAVQVGFASASHFIRSFRQAEGISPLKYRNQARRKGRDRA